MASSVKSGSDQKGGASSSAISDGMRSCMACGKKAARMKSCSGCRVVSYCDASCQRAAWHKHKHECKALRASYS
jgi:hypothetical protein